MPNEQTKALRPTLDRQLSMQHIVTRNPPISFGGVGILIILSSVSLSIGYVLARPEVVRFLELTISPDGSITPDGIHQLDSLFFALMALLLLSGLIVLKARDEDWRKKAKRAFTIDPLVSLPLNLSPLHILAATFLVGVFLIIHIRLYDPASHTFMILYKEDGVFETLTAILTFGASLLLILSSLRARKASKTGWLPSYMPGIYLAFAMVFFLYAMEEISWGQRIIGWETPEAFAVGNVQNETNIHNFFNASFLSAYRLLILFPIPILISIWLEINPLAPAFWRLFLPAPYLVGLGFLIALVAFVWPQEQELLEEMVAVFSVFYSLRIFVGLRAKDTLVSGNPHAALPHPA